MTQAQRFVWLDLVRGISALAVCAGHLRAAIFIDYADLSRPSLLQKIFYFCTGLGHDAVMVFFVLSGLFVGGSVLRNGGQFSLPQYAVARLTRLWVVLLPALILTLCADEVVAGHAPEVLHGALYTVWNSGPSPGVYSISAQTLLGNVFFFHTVLTPVYGSNGPLWSLANEFWYYAAFPLLAIATGQCGMRAKICARVACGIIAAFLLVCLPAGIISGFAVGLQAMLHLPADLAVGLGFAALCTVLATSPPPGKSLLGITVARFAKATSEISYSLYLCHFPLVILIAVFGYGITQVAPGAAAFGIYLAWLAALICLGALFWFLFEKRTEAVKKMASNRLAIHS